MIQRVLFKRLIVVNILLQIFLNIISFFPLNSDPMVERLMRLDGYGAALNIENKFVYLLVPLGFFLASVGLFYFKIWSRYLYLLLLLYSWISTLFFGYRIATPIQGFLGMAIGTIDGVIIYLSFLSPLSKEFERKSQPI